MRLLGVLLTSYFGMLALAFGQNCPTPPAVLHSTLVSACANEPVRSAIGCSMYRLCQNSTLNPPIFPKLCTTWRIASSICSDDPDIARASGICTKLQASYANEAQFRSCMQPYNIRSTSYSRTSIIEDCVAMGGPGSMGGCDTCDDRFCPDPLVSYSEGCYSMDMGRCSPWIDFCQNDQVLGVAPDGKGAAVLCRGKDTSNVVAPPRPPSPPPEGSGVGTPAAAPPPPAPAVSCVANPAQPSCASYSYPEANITADLNSLCGMMPYMPGCTIRKACQSGLVSGRFCQGMVLLATICGPDMPRMVGCRSYVSLCGNGSVVQQCKQTPVIPGLPTTAEARVAIGALCSSGMGMAPQQCSSCNQITCKDYLEAFLGICSSMPGMTGCDAQRKWCQASAAWEQLGSSVAYYCARFYPRPPSPASKPSCTVLPTQPECANFVYRSAAADVAGLCRSMPYMPGCAVLTACQASRVSGRACNNFTILATICLEMPRMPDCATYNQMCAAGSRVPQCRAEPAIPGLPSTDQAKSLIDSLCSTGSPAAGKQCANCTQFSCRDYFGAVASICRDNSTSLPSTTACGRYAAWCRTLTSMTSSNLTYFCKGSENAGPKPPTRSPPVAKPPTRSPPTRSPPTRSPPTRSPPTRSPPARSPPTRSPPTRSPPPVSKTSPPPASRRPPPKRT